LFFDVQLNQKKPLFFDKNNGFLFKVLISTPPEKRWENYN